jgi:hypothetical protein
MGSQLARLGQLIRLGEPLVIAGRTESKTP